MRRDYRPFWLKQILDSFNRWFVEWWVAPQLDGVGRDFRVMYPLHLQVSGQHISVDDHVHVMALPDNPVRLAVYEGLGSIHIGSYCIVNPGVRISSAERIVIGESCMLASNAYICDADWHDLQHRIFAPGNTAPVVLEDNVWVGDSAFVGKGVTVGENSVVGAYAVVTRDVEPNTIVAGNPARVVGKIDPDDLSTRRHLFTGDVPYAEFERTMARESLADNSFVGWLVAMVLRR